MTTTHQEDARSLAIATVTEALYCLEGGAPAFDATASDEFAHLTADEAAQLGRDFCFAMGEAIARLATAFAAHLGVDVHDLWQAVVRDMRASPPPDATNAAPEGGAV